MNKALPYDAEVEWIGVRQNAWVILDNGFVPNDNNVTIDADITFVGYPTSNNFAKWFAARSSPDNGSYRMIRGSSNNLIIFNYNTSDSYNNIFGLSPSENKRYNIHMEYGKAVFNGKIYNLSTNTVSQNTDPFYVGDEGRSRGTNLNVHSFVVTHNGDVVIDAIPVRKGQVGYLYDRVTKRLFGTAGKNPLIVGQDVNSVNTITQNQQRQMYE